MQLADSTPAAVAAFQSFYHAEPDYIKKRSDALGAAAREGGGEALFYDSESEKFTLLEKPADADEAIVCGRKPREQSERTASIDHSANTGGYIASVHGTLDRKAIKIKLANGHYYGKEVDSTLPFFAKFAPAMSDTGLARVWLEKRPSNGPVHVSGRQFGSKPDLNQMPLQSISAREYAALK
jgi:hypothetical protein